MVGSHCTNVSFDRSRSDGKINIGSVTLKEKQQQVEEQEQEERRNQNKRR